MKSSIVALALTLIASTGSFAETATTSRDAGQSRPSAAVVGEMIADTEWSLKHSSVASTLTQAVQDTSAKWLERARAELALGNVLTARELARRAAKPLSTMDPAAQEGRHPDDRAHLAQISATVASLLDGAESIAGEQAAPPEFIANAKGLLRDATTFAAGGDLAAARERVTDAYALVQDGLAGLRDGQRLFLAAAPESSERAWNDGLRRLDERRQLTEYLIIEAGVEGIDPAPLYSGRQEAERALVTAIGQAEQRRWDSALQTLELAYLQHEEAWRAIGIEW